MKRSKRTLLILGAFLGVIFYSTFLVVSSTSVPVREYDKSDTPKAYLRTLQLRLYELVTQKKFTEAEIVFKRIRKLNPDNRSILRLGSVVCYRNGKLNEAENLLKNLLLRNPEDFICRNNYGMVLMAKDRVEAVRELQKAWENSGGLTFIGKNLQRCAKRFNVKLTAEIPEEDNEFLNIPPDAISAAEEKK